MTFLMGTFRACAFLATLIVTSAFAGEPVSVRVHEYQAKAQVISVIPNYVKWPAEAGKPGKDQALVLGVMGVSPFELYLEEACAAQKETGSEIHVKYLRNLAGLDGCHLVFICPSEQERLSEILQYLKDRPILTLSDSKDFAERGVMVNLMLEQRRVRFEVNLTAVRSGHLTLSSHLLRLARVLK